MAWPNTIRKCSSKRANHNPLHPCASHYARRIEDGKSKSPLILAPCLSGAPWDTDAFPSWPDRQLITGQLPEVGGIENYADLIESWAKTVEAYILIGDSFGAAVALGTAYSRSSKFDIWEPNRRSARDGRRPVR